MARTLTINQRRFRLEVRNGLPHINGVPTRVFLDRLKKQKGGRIAIGHLLLAGALLCPKK